MDTPTQDASAGLLAALTPTKHDSEEPWRSPTQDRASPSQGVEVPANHPETHASEASHRALLQDGDRQNTTETKTEDPYYWSMPDLVNWLEGLSWVPTKGIEYITALEGDGEFILTLIESKHCEAVLTEDFGIEKAGIRLLFISKLRKLVRAAKDAKCTSQPANLDQEGPNGGLAGSHTSPTPRRSTLAGEKIISIPGYPIERDSYDFPTAVEFKTWMTSLKVWAGIESSGYSRTIEALYEEPEATVNSRVYDNLNNQQKNIDSILGVHLYTGLPTGVKKHLLKSETYEIVPGKTSGLKILSFIGKKVNKRSSGRWLHISSKLTERKPLQHISELEGELADINVLIDQVTHQGHAFGSKELFKVLHKSIKKLMIQDGSQGKEHPSRDYSNGG